MNPQTRCGCTMGHISRIHACMEGANPSVRERIIAHRIIMRFRTSRPLTDHDRIHQRAQRTIPRCVRLEQYRSRTETTGMVHHYHLPAARSGRPRRYRLPCGASPEEHPVTLASVRSSTTSGHQRQLIPSTGRCGEWFPCTSADFPPRQIVRSAPTPPMVGHEEGSFGYSRSNLRPSHITSIGAAVCAAPQPTHVTSIHGFRMRSLASVPMKDASDGQCGHGALANECRGDFRPSARWVRP